MQMYLSHLGYRLTFQFITGSFILMTTILELQRMYTLHG